VLAAILDWVLVGLAVAVAFGVMSRHLQSEWEQEERDRE
jgi:hypothetical protein